MPYTPGICKKKKDYFLKWMSLSMYNMPVKTHDQKYPRFFHLSLGVTFYGRRGISYLRIILFQAENMNLSTQPRETTAVEAGRWHEGILPLCSFK